MNSWVRLAQLLWPYRRQVILSLVFGFGAAALWSAELILTFPLAKVFVEGKTLEEYTREGSQLAQERIHALTRDLERVDERLALSAVPLDASANAASERVKLIKEQSRLRKRLNDATWRLWMLTYAQTHLLPWLPRNEFHLLVCIFALLLVTTAIKGVCIYAQDLWAGCVAELVVVDLRSAMFRRILRRDVQTVELESGPRLLAGMTYDLQGLAHGLTTLGGRVIREPLKAGACLIAAFGLNWQLTALSLLFLPLAAWMFHAIGRRLKRAVHRVLDTMAQTYQFLEEVFVNVRVVTAFQLQGAMRREFQRQNRRFYQQSLKIVRIDALTNPTTEILGMGAIIVGVLPGAYLLLRDTERIWGIRLSDGPMSVSELVALYALLAGIIDSLRKFSKYFTTIKQCGSSLDRAFSQVDQITGVEESANAVWLPPVSSGIEFRDVHFHFASHEGMPGQERTRVLNGVSLYIPVGETVALVGTNGSGKSTLMGMLPRLYDPTEGAVLFDGMDLRDVRVKDVRRQIAYLPQDVVLFHDTIAENIRYGNPWATSAEIRAAAEQAHVLEFAERFPQGLQTNVGERGRALSGGQRQRVLLARAMLRDPSVLILDEPTSAIDAHSEVLIHRSLKQFVKGRTTFLITHQLGLAVLDYVTLVVVMDQGRVLAMGTPEVLSRTCPMYQQLFARDLTRAA